MRRNPRRSALRPEGLRQAHELDSIVANTELTLISVVQGVALYFLADNARPVIAGLKWELMPHVVSAFFIVIAIWSRSLIHAFTTIRWPLNLVHTWLYFLVAVVEAALFAQTSDSFGWWRLSLVLAVLVSTMFFIERRLYVDRRADSSGAVGKQLLDLLEAEHMFNLRVLGPAMALAYGAIFASRLWWPAQTQGWVFAFDVAQAVGLAGYVFHVQRLYRSVKDLIVEARTEWQSPPAS